MTYTFKIKETAESKGLIEHLRSLKYVEQITDKESKLLTDEEMVARIKKAEKGKKIPYADFVKITESWSSIAKEL